MYTKINQRDIFAGFFYCCVLFSTPSVRLFTFGGNYFPEISVVLCLLYHAATGDLFLSELYRSILHKINFIYFCVISLAALGFLGAVRGGDPLNSYAEFRALLFFVIGLQFVVYEVGCGRLDLITIFATIASLCGFLDWGYNQIFPSADYGPKYVGPIYSAAVAGILGALNGKLKLFYLSVIIAFSCAVVGFYRQYWIVAGAVAIFGVFCGRLRLVNSRIGLIGIFSLIIVFIFAMRWLDNAVEMDESLYIQSVGKTNDLLGFLDGTVEQSESDALRQGYFLFLATNFFESIFPFGLGSRAVFGNISHWFDRFLIPANTLDSVWFYFSFHFGLLLTGIISYIFIVKLVSFVRAIGWLPGCLFFICIMSPTLFDGGALTVLPRAFWLGGLFGIVAYSGQGRIQV